MSVNYQGLKTMTPASDKSNLVEKLSTFSAHWSPKTLSLFNGHDVMVAKFKGEYHWHVHHDTDDFFYVVKGSCRIELRDRTVHLSEGDLYVVPMGVEHKPVADEEAHIMLIERSGTPNSGDIATAAKREFI
jgi:mannose-6-phosphate isomerase-like protein (cupin superfamily)